MTNVTLIELRVCPLFLGMLNTGEHIGLCHRCGREVRRDDAGHTPIMNAAQITRITCTECADMRPRWPGPGPPRRGRVRVHPARSVPVRARVLPVRG